MTHNHEEDEMTTQPPEVRFDDPPKVQVDLNALASIVKTRTDTVLKLRELKKVHSATEKQYTDQIDQIDELLKKALPHVNKDKKYRAPEGGTVSLGVKTNYSVKDRKAFNKFVEDTKDFSLYTSAVGQRAVTAYYKKHGTLPPGVKAVHRTEVNFNTTTS